MPLAALPLARFVTAHEQALHDFVTRESEQGGRRSLEHVHKLLAEADRAVTLPAGVGRQLASGFR